jgi:hypothetical protein
MGFFNDVASSFEADDPNICYMRPKRKWLVFFETYQNHQIDEDKTVIVPWGALSWYKYTVIITCKHCGVRKKAILDEQELSRAGLLDKAKESR